jgi:hypothetical protein
MSFTKVKNNNLYDPDLVTLAEKGVGTGADQIVQRDGSGDIPGIGTSIQAYDATIVVDGDIGTTVQAYDSTILKNANIGTTVQAYDATIVVDADIGTTVQAYDNNIETTSYITKTSSYTALNKDFIYADTATTGAFTITLPLSPSINTTISILDSKGNFATAGLNVARNGETIMGLAEDLMINIDNESVKLIYTGSDWRLV